MSIIPGPGFEVPRNRDAKTDGTESRVQVPACLPVSGSTADLRQIHRELFKREFFKVECRPTFTRGSSTAR